MKKKIHLKLQSKITILMIIVVFASIFNTVYFISRWRINEIREETEISIMNMAKIIAKSPIVKRNLGKAGGQPPIQSYIDDILQSIEHVEVVVVVDMNNIRYAHPRKERIGKEFVGGDEKRVLENAESYISEAEGTLGRQIRAFLPVYDYDGNQVGFVMVGKFITSIKMENNQALGVMILLAFVGVLIGAVGAVILSTNIKKSLLGLEPNEITHLYIQKEGMLEAMHEGIIAIDKNYQITMVNQSAINMLQLDQEDVIGRNVMEVFPSCKLMEVMESGKAEYHREQTINDTTVVINRVPIKNKGKIAGAIATFNDKTDVKRLAEEMTGVKQLTDALRASTHEFMNKLHTILGLIDLGEADEAKKYIMSETEKHQKILSHVIWNIKEPAIAGLLIGKISRANELGIKMKVNNKSTLSKNSAGIDNSSFITILGNLIENAMDALKDSSSYSKIIDVFIKEDKDKITIKVSDNGIGIEKENLDIIFNRGYSTKEGSRGQGLFLVKDVVDLLNGKITVDAILGQGTVFMLELPKEVPND